ncbi:MAG: hypothetical protein ABJH08_12715 [Balneola sp.]
MNEKIIDLAQAKKSSSTAYAGRPEGEEARKIFKLDSIDKDKSIKVEVVFPPNTTSLNPSFFLGLFFKSYKRLGKKRFNDKFKFNLNSVEVSIKENIRKDISDGIEECERTINSNNSIRALFK